MRANMAAKIYSSIILFYFLLVSWIFLPYVCVKSRDKDLNSTNSHLFHVKIPADYAGQTWLNKNLSNAPAEKTSCRMEEAWLYLRLSST